MALVKLLVRDEENNRTLQLFLTPEQRDRACSDESYVEQLMQEHDLNKTEEARNYARLLSDTFRQKIFFEVITTVLDKQNFEGFASIILRLAAKSGTAMTPEQMLLCYQWLEYIAMYSNQAATNPTFAKSFLQDINKALEKNTYLTGQILTVADVAAYYVLYSLLERLNVLERESILHVCRWSKHIQAQPRVCASKAPLPLHTLSLSVLAPTVH